MRLAVFTDSNIFYPDGFGRIAQALIAYLRGRPANSLIVFHRGDGTERAESMGENVTVYSVAAPYLHVPSYDAYPFIYLLTPRKRLLRIAGKFRPDIVLTISPYLPWGIGRSALYVAEKLRTPLVGSFDLHLMLVSERYGRTFLKSALAVWLGLRCASLLMRSYQKCARILVPSRFVWEHVKETYGLSKCVMFPRGVNCERFSPLHRDESFKVQYGIEGKVTILYAGRLSVEKNLDALLGIYTRLRAENGNMALVLVGDGPERERIKAQRLPDLVLTGTLYSKELSRAYASAELFAFPSLVDAGPMVIVEAMASGLPVVVFNQGGAQDAVIHGETGFVAKTVPDFIGCVDTLIRDTQLRLAMGAKARRRAEEHRWERVLDDLMATFEEAKGARG